MEEGNRGRHTEAWGKSYKRKSQLKATFFCITEVRRPTKGKAAVYAETGNRADWLNKYK